jgi:D-amino-acid dehydrogenase
MAGLQKDPVIIVGGGVIGACCAYFLAHGGVRVLLLEEHEIASGCSFGNLGLLAASHCTPLASPGVISKALLWMFSRKSPFSIHWRADPQLAAWLWQFVRASRLAGAFAATAALLQLVFASMSVFETLSCLSDLGFGLERRGVLELFVTSSGFARAKERAQSLSDAGLNLEMLDARAAKAAEPLATPNVKGGLLYHDDHHLLPADFVHTIASLAKCAGAEVREHAGVIDFITTGDRITGVATKELFSPASAVILAAGSASQKLARLLNLRLPVQPARGYSFTAPSHGHSIFRPIMLSESKTLLTPIGTNLRLGGVLELTEMNSPIDPKRARALIQSLPQYLSSEISFEGIEPWSGDRPCSPDGFPIVGWSQRWLNLLYATGHGMLGLTLGPLTGQIVTDLVMGNKPAQDMTRLCPSRFGGYL